MRITQRGTTLLLAAAAGVALAGCSLGSHQPRHGTVTAVGVTTTTRATPVPDPNPPPPPPPVHPIAHPVAHPVPPPRPHFTTPQAAMRYLTAAYNRNDLVSLRHVTTPAARVDLLAMRSQAVNLQLAGCTPGAGDYTCTFTHDFPPARHQSGQGHATFTAAPADSVGWYMTVLESCD